MTDPAFAAAEAAHRAGRLAEAEAGYRAILGRNPRDRQTLLHLGMLAEQTGRRDAAAALYAQATTVAPNDLTAWRALAVVVKDDDPARAIASLQRALALMPADGAAWAHLGDVDRRIGELLASRQNFARALALDPGDAGAWSNYATACEALAEPVPAVAALRTALALAPADGNALWNFATQRLNHGDWRVGWRYYERRFEMPGHRLYRRDVTIPDWTGEPLAGRRLLVYADQGIGDTIHFARYLPLLAGQGAEVLFECNPELIPLMASLRGIETIMPRGAAVPPVDRQVAISSLPFLFRTEPATAPNAVPYLAAPADRLARWGARLGTRERPRIGLVWAGNPGYSGDRQRSLPLAALAPMLNRSGLDFYALQVGAARGQIAALEWAGRLTDLGAEIGDFADTAAILGHLDVLISCDTSVAHLAGALSRPVWIALPAIAEWRWMTGTNRSVWYPTARLFRQRHWGAWDDVVDRLSARLAEIYHFPA